MSASRAAWLWLPVLVWAGMIFALSAIPSLDSGLGSWDFALRKLAHATEYAVLGALLLRATSSETAAFAGGIAYAITDEIHQTFVAGRHGAPLDVAIDGAGVLIGVLVARRLARR